MRVAVSGSGLIAKKTVSEDCGSVSGLSVMLLGGWWLLGDNAGTVGQLEANAWIDPSFVTQMQEIAADLGLGARAPLAQVLYDYVASEVSDVRRGDVDFNY